MPTWHTIKLQISDASYCCYSLQTSHTELEDMFTRKLQCKVVKTCHQQHQRSTLAYQINIELGANSKRGTYQGQTPGLWFVCCNHLWPAAQTKCIHKRNKQTVIFVAIIGYTTTNIPCLQKQIQSSHKQQTSPGWQTAWPQAARQHRMAGRAATAQTPASKTPTHIKPMPASRTGDRNLGQEGNERTCAALAPNLIGYRTLKASGFRTSND